ncbi:MAG TPA: MBL fold metallo-hydrolase [Bacillota bacterium]|nr:MBL fold metallo-hydrolase [Bacillota bacterium]
MRKILLLTVFFSLFLTTQVQSSSEDFSTLAVHFLGITEGEASLIRFPDGYTVVIDSGSHQSGKEVAQLLFSHHVKRIDTLILTGQMDGHIGGTEELLKHFPIEKILVPEPLQSAIQNKVSIPQNVLLLPVREGQNYTFPMGVVLKILHPGEPLSLSPEDNSLVLQLVHQHIKILFTSDINERTEQLLVKKYNVKSQILKVSDGGSNQASDPKFLKQVDAHAAIIFHDGHPRMHPKVLERLTETWMDVYQTKSHGTVSIFSNGKHYRIRKENQKGYFNNGKFHRSS